MSDKTEDTEHLIFCQIGPRLVARLNLNGEFKVLTQNFSDDEDFDMQPFIQAFNNFAQLQKEENES